MTERPWCRRLEPFVTWRRSQAGRVWRRCQANLRAHKYVGYWKFSSPYLLLTGQSLTGSSEPWVAWSRRWQGWCWCWRCPGGLGCPAASKSHASFVQSCCRCCSPLQQQCSPASELLGCKKHPKSVKGGKGVDKCQNVKRALGSKDLRHVFFTLSS